MSAPSLNMRSQLREVSTAARKEWAIRNQELCSLCAKFGKPGTMSCHYPSHWSGPRLEKAFHDLLQGDASEIVSPAPVNPEELSVEPLDEPKEGAADPGAAFAELVRQMARGALDEKAVRKIVDTELMRVRSDFSNRLNELAEKGGRSLEIVVKGPAGAVKLKERVHPAFEPILKRAAARIPILLVGPAGCGKSHVAGQVATALKLPFYFISCTAGMSEGQLTGRLIPTGEGGRFEYCRSEFVRAYEEGGVFLLDEIDAADPNTLLIINTALANGHMAVPNRPEKPVATRHPDFILISAANTFGNGADRQYVGRFQLDAATLNRFSMGTVTMDYDQELEKELAPAPVVLWGLAVRNVIRDHKLRRVLSTRNLIHTAQLLAAGETPEGCRASYFSGWSAEELRHVGPELR